MGWVKGELVLTFLVGCVFLLLLRLFNCHLYERLDLVHHLKDRTWLCPVFGLLFNDRVIFTIIVIHFIVCCNVGLSNIRVRTDRIIMDVRLRLGEIKNGAIVVPILLVKVIIVVNILAFL